jgi:hypothetical protein
MRIDESGTYDVPEKRTMSNVDYLAALQVLRGKLLTNIQSWGAMTDANREWLTQRHDQLDALNDVIDIYDKVVQAEAEAQAADTALQNANADMTPAQLLELQLNQQNANAKVEEAKAQANSITEAEKIKSNFAAGNTKYYIIAAVVVVIVIGVIVFMLKRKG